MTGSLLQQPQACTGEHSHRQRKAKQKAQGIVCLVLFRFHWAQKQPFLLNNCKLLNKSEIALLHGESLGSHRKSINCLSFSSIKGGFIEQAAEKAPIELYTFHIIFMIS